MSVQKFDIQKATGPVLTKRKLKNGQQPTLRQMQLRSRPQAQRTAIVADISGSMSENKMSELKRCLSSVWSPGIYGIAFSSVVYEIEQSDIPKLEPEGTTNMQEALEITWKADIGHIILLTDGQPDQNKNTILADVISHKEIPIDTVGIGDKGTSNYDPVFLAEISHITGGRFTDCGEAIKLTGIVQHLLEYKPQGLTAPKGGVIQL